jgi:hypothetical protein
MTPSGGRYAAVSMSGHSGLVGSYMDLLNFPSSTYIVEVVPIFWEHLWRPGHDCFLPHALQFITHLSQLHLMLHSLSQ